MAPSYQKGKKKRSYYGPVAKRANVYGPATMQLAKDVAYLASLVNSEPKHHTVSLGSNFDWNGTVLDLTAIPQGDGTTTRDGVSVLPRYLNVRFHINKLISGATQDHATYRFVIFRSWIEDANAATPVVPSASDVLSANGTARAPLGTVVDDISGARGDRERRIEILRSEFNTLDVVGKTCADYNFNIEMNGPSKSRKEHIKFTGNSTHTAISGGIYALFIAGSATASELALTFNSKVTFYDN